MELFQKVTASGQPFFDVLEYNEPVKLQSKLSWAIARIHGHVRKVRDSEGFWREVRTDMPNKILRRVHRYPLDWSTKEP